MRRALGLALAVYAPHLLEEALTGMDRDAVAPAIALLDPLPRSQAVYLVFQATLLLGLALAYAVLRGGAPARLALAALALALLAESHHLLRAAWQHRYNPGLLTAWPMPFLGARLLADVLPRRRGRVQPTHLQGAQS